jgi:restriction system protein
MAIPNWEKLMLPILKLMEPEKDYKRTEMFERLKPQFTKEELEETVASGEKSKLFDRVGWAFTYLTKAEFIAKSLERKASYYITDLGLKALEDGKKGIEINYKYLENSPNFNSNMEVKKEQLPDFQTEEDVDIRTKIDELNQGEKIKLLAKLREMPWQEFEDFCVSLLEKMGYGVGKLREKRQRDGGIDGVLSADELEIKGKIYIQAKRFDESSRVSSPQMRDFLYIVREKEVKGVFITTSRFSSDAMEEARRHAENGAIALIDESRLVELCTKYNHGIKVRELLEILEVNL